MVTSRQRKSTDEPESARRHVTPGRRRAVLRFTDLHDRNAALRRRVARLDAALRAARERSAAIFETVRGGLAVLDEDLCVVAANRRFSELCRGAGHVIGCSVFEVLDVDEDLQRLRTLLDAAVEGPVCATSPMACRAASGETLRVSVTLTPVPLAEDGLIILIATEDVTELVEHRRHLEEANARLAREADDERATAAQRGEQLRALVGDMALIEERERRRIAQLLHGDLQQLLLGARLSVEHSLDRLVDPGVHAALTTALDALGQATGIARSFAAGLLPPVLYEGGLVPAIRWLGRQHARTSGLTIWVDPDPTLVEVPRTQRVILFQAVSELLLNVAKHARASHVDVALRRLAGDVVQISVSDDGVGFDASTLRGANAAQTGIGLFTNRERLEALGGRMTVASGPELGTRVTLELPLWRETAPP